jgi:nucleoside-diphosphate-sugar epimerase
MMMSTSRVAVTGITGHLGFVLASQLIERGYAVRAVVRDIKRVQNMGWITQLPIELARADMTDQKAMEEALSGMDGLFHVAGVFDVTSQDPVRDVIQKNIKGAERTLMAAVVKNVRKVIYTSSVAAVGTSQRVDEWRDESNWNDNSPEPYARSKALAERKAWEIATQFKLNLVTALPATILGPQFHKLNPSLGLIESGLMGKFPMAPPIDFNIVDVRDIAAAHIKLYESNRAKGRYILANQTLSVLKVLMLIKEIRPQVSVPKKQMPLWLARIFPAVDWLSHFLTHKPRQMTMGFVKEYVGRHHAIHSKKMENQFGWSPRDFRATLEDTIGWFEQIQMS